MVSNTRVGFWPRGVIGRALEVFRVHVVLGPSLCEAYDKRGHGHFDVELDHVGDRVELDVHDLVLQEHETDEHGVHGDGDNHQFPVETNKWCVLLQSMLLHEPFLDSPKEVPVESSVDEENNDLGDLIPDGIDSDKCVASRWVGMRWKPDAKDSDVDGGDEEYGAPFEITNGTSMLGDECDSVDDDLHK